jgi:hypothetical protein
MKKADFKVGDYVCALNVTNKVLTISEVEYFKDLDDYVYYTLDGQSFGGLQLELMKSVFKKEYEKYLINNKMSREQQIEEILIESHSYGVRHEVMETAKEIMSSNHKIDRLTAYELAYREWVK